MVATAVSRLTLPTTAVATGETHTHCFIEPSKSCERPACPQRRCGLESQSLIVRRLPFSKPLQCRGVSCLYFLPYPIVQWEVAEDRLDPEARPMVFTRGRADISLLKQLLLNGGDAIWTDEV